MIIMEWQKLCEQFTSTAEQSITEAQEDSIVKANVYKIIARNNY